MPQNMSPYTGTEPFIFISYSHRDTDRVLPAVHRLIAAGFRVWYDDAIELGREWDNDIALHVRDCSVFIPFLTQNYLASVNCKNELRYALSKSCKCLAVYLEEVSFESDPGIEMYISVNQNIMAHRLTPEAFFIRLAKLPLLQSCRNKPQPAPVQPAAPAPRIAPQQPVQQMPSPQQNMQPQFAQQNGQPPQNVQQQFTQPQNGQFAPPLQPQKQFAQQTRMAPQQPPQLFVQQTAQPQATHFGQPLPVPQGQQFAQPQTAAQTAQTPAKAAEKDGSAPNAGFVIWLLNVLGLLYSLFITIGVAAVFDDNNFLGMAITVAIFYIIPAVIGLLMIRFTESRYPVPRTKNNFGLLLRYFITGYYILFPLLMTGYGSTYTWQIISNLVIAPFICLLILSGTKLRQIVGGNKLLTQSLFFWFFVLRIFVYCIETSEWYHAGKTIQYLAICIFCVKVIISECRLLKRKEYGNSSQETMIARVFLLGLLTALALAGCVAGI